MARSSNTPSRNPRPSRRTQIVWLTFFGAMGTVVALLALVGGGRSGGFLATNLDAIGTEADRRDPVFAIDVVPDRQRWRSIVIHHLGAPAGDAESIHRQHLNYGYQGLGYHFLIGNGNGLGDGIVHVGYRWNRQLPGAHTVGPRSDELNQHAIGICLIGNGDRRPFTDRQMRNLTLLVQRLQDELGIPAESVYLHRDVAPQVSSPGRYFATASLEVLDLRR